MSLGKTCEVGRVIWINGSFSAGKTTVASLVVEQLAGSFLLDPESIGAAFRDHVVPASLYPGGFQDLSLWRSFTRDAVLDAAERSDSVIVVPMTVARPDYFEEIVGQIRARVRLDHYTLMASRDTILRREASRFDDTRMAAKTVDYVLPELADSRYAVHLDVETQSPQDIAVEIVRQIRSA
jgi:chloramphenicol 3-O-phosphotransferase